LIGIDTNVLVRYFAGDDPVQSPLAENLLLRKISAASPGFVSLVALAELIWVMQRSYRCARNELVHIVQQLLVNASLRVQNSDAVWLALDEFETAKRDFSDALIAALGTQHGCTHTVTFDKGAAAMAGVELLR
jgi:predicted nucleic-acid-binding protein